MINIDDLMRSRLSGAEEREPSGAWTAMRDLLDKEMPVEPVAALNWRRLMGYTAGILVAVSASLGGYKMMSSTGKTTGVISARLSSPADRATSIVPARTIDGLSASAAPDAGAVAASDLTSNRHGNNPAPHTTGGSHNGHRTRELLASGNTTGIQSASLTDDASANRTSDLKARRHNADANGAGHAATRHSETTIGGNQSPETDPSSGSATTASAIAPRTHRAAQHRNNAPLTAEAAPTHRAGAPGTIAGNHTSQVPSTVPAVTPATNHASADRQQDKVAALTPHAVEAAHTPGNTAQPVVPSSGSNAGTASTTTAPMIRRIEERRVDSVRQIEIAYRMVYNPVTQKKHYQIDTIGFRTIPMERIRVHNEAIAANNPAVAEETGSKRARRRRQQQAATRAAGEATASTATTAAANHAVTSSANPAPAASLTREAVDNNSNNLVSLSNYKVSGRFTRMWDANAQRVHAFMQNVDMTIARSQFYTGITGGFNTTVFSANTLAGFQLGLTGLLAFNEYWSLAADLKYTHRFNSSSINDNYLRVSNVVPGAESQVNGVSYREYTWDQENVIHYYNLTAVQTVELPVTLRRNIGRVFGEAGLNMFYSFNVNVEEVERNQGNQMTMTRLFPLSSSPGESLGSGKHVTVSDFNSRFGLGYVLGAGYEFTPAVNASVRVVQNFWDNAQGGGAGKVSRNLFQTPSLQFSIGYRFSQGRR